jgi:glucose/arabinose dehydrogenase
MVPAAGVSAAVGTSTFSIGLEPVTSVAGPSLDLTHAGDGTDRLFLAGQNTGDVRIFKNGALVTTPFLDVNGTGVTGANLPLATTGERGLLGMAFHPNFAMPGMPGFGKFYTYTSESTTLTPVAGLDFIHDELDGTEAAPANLGNHDSVIREWTVSSTNPDQLSMAAGDRREIMRIRQPQANHNGGALKFGPDGMLYIALGDGGGGDDTNNTANDGHTDASATVRGNAQDVQDYPLARNLNVLGKILRIDPRDPATTPASIGATGRNGRYRIPSDNPRIGISGADEIWAYGLRNPFRMSFDRVGGSLYVGDVGQAALEEVDIISRNGNYGWVYWEGSSVKFAEPAGLPDIKPIAEYTHADGQAIIGGFVYRGQNIPELYGKYIFGELGWNDPATPETTIVGRIFVMEPAGGAINQFQYMLNAPNAQLYAFGEDRDGELYAMFADGNVQRILGKQWFATTGGSWGTAANWLGPIPNSIGAAANFLGRVPVTSPGAPAINLDGNRTVGSMLFNNALGYRIAPGTGGTLSLDNSGSSTAASIKVINGNHEISAPLSIVSNAEMDIGPSGSLNITSTTSIAASRTLTKKGSGAATMQGIAMQSTSTLAVSEGTLTIRSATGGAVVVSGGRLNIAPKVGSGVTSRINTLNVTGLGKLDLSDNKMIVVNGSLGTFSGTSYNGITGMIARAYDFGAWDGNGVTTSQPQAAQGLTGVGIITGAQTGRSGSTWGGYTIADGDVLLMYTYMGDCNFDGLVDASDYGIIDNYYQFPGTTGYGNGDFNFDGVIDAGDYGLIDNSFQLQGAPISTNGSPFAIMAVPEPSSALVIGLAAATFSLVRPRRRRRQLAIRTISLPT